MASIINLRNIANVIVAVLLVIAAGGRAWAEQGVKVNEVLRSLFYAPQYVAMSLGAFEEEGVSITELRTTWGTQAAITELISGGSNIGLVGPEAAALTWEAEPSRRLYNFAALTSKDGSFILSKEPMDSFNVSDLKGKTIVTGGAGSTPYLALIHLIRAAGLDPKKDVTVRAVPISANIIPSFLESNAEFAQAFDPAVEKAVESAGVHRVASVGELMGTMPYTAYAASANFIENNPETVQGFANAIQKGLTWTNNHTAAEIAEKIAPYFDDVSLDMIETVVQEYKNVNAWPDTIEITPEGMKSMLDLLVEGDILEDSSLYDKIVVQRFAQTSKEGL